MTPRRIKVSSVVFVALISMCILLVAALFAALSWFVSSIDGDNNQAPEIIISYGLVYMKSRSCISEKISGGYLDRFCDVDSVLVCNNTFVIYSNGVPGVISKSGDTLSLELASVPIRDCKALAVWD